MMMGALYDYKCGGCLSGSVCRQATFLPSGPSGRDGTEDGNSPVRPTDSDPVTVTADGSS